MEEFSTEIYENSKILFKEACQYKFLIKIIILFILYIFANYIFDRIDHEDLIRTFHDRPTITIKLPNNTTFKIIITFIMIFISHFVYKIIIKPIVYKID